VVGADRQSGRHPKCLGEHLRPSCSIPAAAFSLAKASGAVKFLAHPSGYIRGSDSLHESDAPGVGRRRLVDFYLQHGGSDEQFGRTHKEQAAPR
jgi:hypothetical protein